MKAVYFAGGVCALLVSFIGPQQAFGQSKAKTNPNPARNVPVKKVFPFYDLYLNLPAEGRDGFRLKYRLSSPGPNLPRAQMNYVLGATRTPIEIGPSGQILTMPNSAMLASGRVDIPANQPSARVVMDLEPVISMSRSIPVTSVNNALSDYSNAVRRAGPLAALAPKLKGIEFSGSTGGEVVFGDGRRVTIPVTPRGVTFQPGAPNMRGAVSLAFATPPNNAAFSQ